MKLLKSLVQEFTNTEYREKIFEAEKELERVRIASIEYLETLAKSEQAVQGRKEQSQPRAARENRGSELKEGRELVKAKKSEKIFNCDQCDYKTKWSSSLSRHRRTHSGEKPFICDLCDYACAESANLIRHKNTQ